VLPLWADLLATVVFGLSGALLARESSLDLVSAAGLAVVAGTGGGIVRDVVLGDTPPVAFEEWSILVAASASVLVAAVLPQGRGRWHGLYVVADAAGLGLVTAAGTLKSLDAGLGAYPAILLGVLSGVGGGVVRDLLATRLPMVLHPEVYATAALAGAVVVALVGVEPPGVAITAGATTTFLVRVVSRWRHWEVPRLGREGGR
jgi:uncharacterized membrane protein YeiH